MCMLLPCQSSAGFEVVHIVLTAGCVVWSTPYSAHIIQWSQSEDFSTSVVITGEMVQEKDITARSKDGGIVES